MTAAGRERWHRYAMRGLEGAMRELSRGVAALKPTPPAKFTILSFQFSIYNLLPIFPS
jgi:hypothetical protein